MTAPIKAGARVVMTPLGYERCAMNHPKAKSRVTIGTCVREDRFTITVLRDGTKLSRTYARDFWQALR